jgi:hypothetical protein
MVPILTGNGRTGSGQVRPRTFSELGDGGYVKYTPGLM